MPEFPTSGPLTIDVRLAGGSVDLSAEPRDSAQIEVAPDDDSEVAREAAARTRVELSGDQLVIAAPEASGWLLRRSPRLRVTGRVPAGSTLRLKSAAADVTGHGEWADAKLNTATGDVYLERATGDLTVNTASGDIRADAVGGRLTVLTGSGDVSAQQVSGPADVKNASGDVRIDDAGADLTVTTASGNATVGTTRQGWVRATTVSGNVSIGVAAGTGVWLDLNTLFGQASSDLTVTDDAGGDGHELTVQVRAVSGNVEVHRVNLPAQAG